MKLDRAPDYPHRQRGHPLPDGSHDGRIGSRSTVHGLPKMATAGQIPALRPCLENRTPLRFTCLTRTPVLTDELRGAVATDHLHRSPKQFCLLLWMTVFHTSLLRLPILDKSHCLEQDKH